MRFTLLFMCLLLTAFSSQATARPYLILQSTTSTQNSGLYEAILPAFERQAGFSVRVVAVGTGQALRNAQNCDGDIVLVHAREAEQAFIDAGFGTKRLDVMFNDFVLLGPRSDPAGVAGSQSARQAFSAIEASRALFTSRGDDSGTHKKERALWEAAGLAPQSRTGKWYLETGSGMGSTLNVAVEKGAYILSDRGTWISFRNKGKHKILLEGDEALFNPYGLIPVNPAHCPRVEAQKAQIFTDWITGPEGQAAIADYRLEGQTLFFPNAAP